MKHLLQYEKFSFHYDVEDILLPFIDDGICKMEGGQHLKQYSFRDKGQFNKAIELLQSRNATRWGMERYIYILYSYTEELENRMNRTFDNLTQVDSGGVYRYYNKDNREVMIIKKDLSSVYCERNLYWSILEKNFNLERSDIKLITKLFIQLKFGYSVDSLSIQTY